MSKSQALSDWEAEWDAYSQEAHRTQGEYDKAHMAYLTAIQLHRPQPELDGLLTSLKAAAEAAGTAIRNSPKSRPGLG